MAGAYTFLWLSETGSVAGVDSVDCRDDDDAIGVAWRLLDEHAQAQAIPPSQRIDAYLGTRLVHQVQRREA